MIFLWYENSTNEWSEVLVPGWNLLEIWILIAESACDGSSAINTKLIDISMNSAPMNMFKNRINKGGVSFINFTRLGNFLNNRMSMVC